MSAADEGGRPPPVMVHGFAATLREFRLLSGLTQAGLARRAGVSLGTVRDLEQGRRARPRAASVARLAQALGLDDRQAARLAGAGPPAWEPARAPVPGTKAGLQVRVLGPVAAWRDGRPLDVGPVRQRAVLALLALGRGSPVRRDALVDALWPQGPPPTAVNIVQGQISELRRALGGNEVVSRSGESYRLRLGPAELDVLAFDELTEQAGTPGDPVRSCELYERALGLWRGEVAQDAAAVTGYPAATALAAQRAAAVVELARLASDLGQPERALPELRALAGREPLNERAHAWLMTALAGAGQQAAALEVFEGCQARLDAELGVRPGPELARAHERVLRQEDLPTSAAMPRPGAPPVPAPDSAQPSGRREARAVPRQLPAAVSSFVGRAEELATLDGLADRAARPPQDRGPGQDRRAGQDSRPGQDRRPGQDSGTIVISAIGGTAGVGKTALAVHWAHRVADRFPGGQLYVNLRGYDPDQPVSAADALAGFLRALGVPATEIDPGTDERAAQYRTLLAGRRMLVVLDNVGSVEQVRPLLPGTSSCVVVVTSRDALAGLVARDGARRLDLDLLPPAEAAALLRELIGERAGADPASTERLAGLCARLPLALRVAAEHAIARPAVPLAGLVAELTGLPGRLDLLDVSADAHTAVRAVFSWSCRSLDAPTARAYRLAGLHPGPDLDAYAVAAMTGAPVGRARELMDRLARAYLVQVSLAGRYGMHDLLRGYARELSAGQDGEQEQRAALTRLFGHYLSTVTAAITLLHPIGVDSLPAPTCPAQPAAPIGDPATALAWLDAQRPGLVMAVAYMTAHGWPDLAIQLTRTLYPYLYARVHLREALTMFGHAREAARQAGDRVAEAAMLTHLGGFCWLQGRHQQAAEYLDQALALARQTGDRHRQARVLHNLGLIEAGRCRYPQAGQYATQALALFQEAGDLLRQARAMNSLGCIQLRQGRYPQASGNLTAAVELCRAVGSRFDESIVLSDLGLLELRQGYYEHAAGHLHTALALARALGGRDSEAPALLHLGLLELRRDRREQAASHLEAALAMCREAGLRPGEAEALAALAELTLRQGDGPRAAALGRQSLALAMEIGHRGVEAEALTVIGDVHLAAGQPDGARDQYAAALRVATEIGDQQARDRAGHGLHRVQLADVR